MIDIQGNEITPIKYDSIQSFCFGLAVVSENNGENYGYIDISGKEVIPCIYKEAFDFDEGFAVVSNGEYYGVINSDGNKITDFEYFEIYKFNDGIAMVQKGEFRMFGFINERGEEIIPCWYYSASSFNEGLGMFSQNFILKSGGERSKTWVIDKSGNKLFINEGGSSQFHEGLMPVSKNGKWGYIDKTGNIAIQYQYRLAERFKNGVAIIINEEDLKGVINKSGVQLIPMNYDLIRVESETIFGKKDNKWGLFSKEGTILIPPIYDSIGNFKEGFCRVCINGKEGYINTDGILIIPLIDHFLKQYFLNLFVKN